MIDRPKPPPPPRGPLATPATYQALARHAQSLALQSRLENAFASISAGLMVVDNAWFFTYVNQRAATVWHKSPEEMVGRSMWALLPSLVGSELHEVAQGAMKSRTPARVEVFYDSPGRWVEFQLHPFPQGLVFFDSDITERKRSDGHETIAEALRLSEQRLAAASKSGTMTVSQHDRELRYTWINDQPEKYQVADIIGRRDVGVLPRLAEAKALEAFKRQVMESGIGDRRRFRINVWGAERELDVVAEPLRDPRGEVIGLTCAAFEISAHVELQARLQQQADQLARMDQRKNEFIATLAHELRNPLAPIHNAVHVLKIQPDPPDPQHLKWATDIIGRQVSHLMYLVDDLLDVARIAHGRIKLNRETLELGTVLEQALESARPALSARKQTVRSTLAPDAIYVEADRTRIQQIIGNLLSNASRYTRTGGLIELLLQREADEALISVKDNGIGITAEALPTIFELFSQGAPTPDQSSTGLGLGLALVRRLVELHGGSVRAHSDGPGMGSEFVVRMPVSQAQPAAPSEATTPAAARGWRILVVDDNHDVAQSLAILLELMGHTVQAVNNAAAALAAVQSYKPSVVFLDMRLADANGDDLARALRSVAPNSRMHFIALTGYGDEELRRRVTAAGFAAHLLKPATVEALESALVSLPTLE